MKKSVIAALLLSVGLIIPAGRGALAADPGVFQVPGTDTTLKIYGFARFDANYDFNGRADTWMYVPAIDDEVDDGTYDFTAAVSRFGFTTSTPSGGDKVTVKIEGDFLSDGNKFRLRHGYGEYANLLAGQTWSNYIDLDTLPETVDFNGPLGLAGHRSPQIRYTLPMGASSLSVAVEEAPNGNKSVPDLTARYSWNGNGAHLAVYAMTTEYKTEDYEERGYGVGISGSIAVGNATIMGGVQGGKGVGDYMVASIGQAYRDTGTELELWEVVGYNLAVSAPLASNVRGTIAGSYAKFSENDDDTANETLYDVYANIFWGFAKNAEVGVEYAWGKRETFNEWDATASRVNVMFQYNFF